MSSINLNKKKKKKEVGNELINANLTWLTEMTDFHKFFLWVKK